MELATLYLTDYILKQLDNNLMNICLDLSKAFDSLDHNLKKHYESTGAALSLFRSYLADRRQYVVYDKLFS